MTSTLDVFFNRPLVFFYHMGWILECQLHLFSGRFGLIYATGPLISTISSSFSLRRGLQISTFFSPPPICVSAFYFEAFTTSLPKSGPGRSFCDIVSLVNSRRDALTVTCDVLNDGDVILKLWNQNSAVKEQGLVYV